MVEVAGSDVPLQNGEHIVIWFGNQGRKTVIEAEFQLSLLDSAGLRHPALRSYLSELQVAPGNGGLIVHSTEEEAQQWGAAWRNIRGLEVQTAHVLFADGTRWEGSACKQTFRNADYIESMRRWNTELRLTWNRNHPNDPIPSRSMAALLELANDMR